ncbi:hypothetical protein [Pseudooceanicola sp.]|uniref:hypothetical protein n=1 Tax=Pseudooceanicola sp. TaxID=1914328 RepID=UPI0035C6FCC9
MSILSELLGDSSNTSYEMSSDSSATEFGANPGASFGATDILSFSSMDDGGDEATSFTGIGSIGFGVGAPVMIGTSSMSESTSASDSNSDGLLGGLF